ncbi:hypothetical protein [Paenibacillus arenilitoris]|uniref:Uncharacterized protein n=1 Tax=Paenibacillus arenilitoris TaxID=2772299 RepID=A0A927H896_9BACL|nr:hypothetical protein [Paenibacillus arenilitoris]MBD2871337.1 hypothetical protein [Paenibacillus arenilitoris]
MFSVQKLTLSMLVLLFLLLAPAAATAASFEFTVTAKAAFDKMKAAADKTTSAKLASQYAQLQAVQKQEIEWEAKINTLHYRNEEAVLGTRNRIKAIDAAKIAKLEADVVQTKKKYEPLFDLYDSLKQQLSLAKSLKDKWLVGVLNPQVETAKAAAALAKADIRGKEAALKAAKADAAKAMKKIKDVLAGIDAVKIKIKASKSSVSSLKKQFKTETTILNQVVRKGDPTASVSSFTRLLAYMKQINEHRQKHYAYEQQISAIIAKADAQLKAR